MMGKIPKKQPFLAHLFFLANGTSDPGNGDAFSAGRLPLLDGKDDNFLFF